MLERRQAAHALMTLDQVETPGIGPVEPKGTVWGVDDDDRYVPRPCRPHGHGGFQVPVAVKCPIMVEVDVIGGIGSNDFSEKPFGWPCLRSSSNTVEVQVAVR